MEVSKRLMTRSNWLRVEDRKYVYDTIESSEFSGAVGLIHIKSVTGPSIKIYCNKPVKIVDNGYYWLQFAPKDKQYWLTVMYNEKEELIQYYFDITKENVTLDKGESYFYDLFLDIVLLPDGSMFLLDEDELEEALMDKTITERDFEKAHAVADELMKKLKGNENKLREFCYEYFYRLKDNL
jgi:uncharacterized protein